MAIPHTVPHYPPSNNIASVTVTNLELVRLDDALVDMLLDLVYHRQHRYVRLSRAGRSAHEQVLVTLVGSVEHDRLDTVERLHALERDLTDLRGQGHSKVRARSRQGHGKVTAVMVSFNTTITHGRA